MSYISDVSVSIGSSLFQVYNDYTKPTYFLDGVENAELPSKISSLPLYVSHPDPDTPFHWTKPSVFTIQINEVENIKISFMRGFLNVDVDGTSRNFGSVSGLIGSWHKQGRIARDGETLIRDPNAYAQEWQVRSDEPNLFKESRYPQYPEKCLLPSTPETDEKHRL